MKNGLGEQNTPDHTGERRSFGIRPQRNRLELPADESAGRHGLCADGAVTRIYRNEAADRSRVFQSAQECPGGSRRCLRLLGRTALSGCIRSWSTVKNSVSTAGRYYASWTGTISQTRPLWQPTHRSKAFTDCGSFDCPVADRLNADALSLPSSVAIADEDIQSVIEVLHFIQLITHV